MPFSTALKEFLRSNDITTLSAFFSGDHWPNQTQAAQAKTRSIKPSKSFLQATTPNRQALLTNTSTNPQLLCILPTGKLAVLSTPHLVLDPTDNGNDTTTGIYVATASDCFMPS